MFTRAGEEGTGAGAFCPRGLREASGEGGAPVAALYEREEEETDSRGDALGEVGPDALRAAAAGEPGEAGDCNNGSSKVKLWSECEASSSSSIYWLRAAKC